MSDHVKVDDLEIFRVFRAALLKFAQAASNSLSAADSEISSTLSWLEGEQASYWQTQLRKRTEMVTAAREAVRQKKLYKDSSGRYPGAIEEEKHLARCLTAVEQARQKVEAVRRWIPKLEDEAQLYRGGVARLSGAATADIPKAVALLDRLAERLEAYVQMTSPAGYAPDSAATVDASLARGGDTAEEPPPIIPHADAQEPAAPENAAHTEDKNVPDGK